MSFASCQDSPDAPSKDGTQDETMSPSDVLFPRDCLPESDTRALTKSVERIAELQLEIARVRLAEAEIAALKSDIRLHQIRLGIGS